MPLDTSPSRPDPLAYTQLGRVANFAGRYLYAAGIAAWTLTLGLASPRRRALLSRLAREARYPERPAPTLPARPLDSITSAHTAITLPVPEEADGSVTLLELVALARLVRERQPRALFEIGTFDGRTTTTLAANAPDDAVVHTLDLPATQSPALDVAHGERLFIDKPVSGGRVRESRYASRVTQHYGDSATFDFTPYPSDFVFVDGSHAYEYVLNDTRKALAVLRPGGIIVWHDYGEWSGVTRALDELRHSDPRCAGLARIHGTSLALLAP